MPHILVVDNSNDDYQQVEQLLNGSHTVACAINVQQAITVLGNDAPPPSAVLLDSALPEGLNLIQHIKEERSSIPIVLVSSEGHELEAIELLKQGASSYVPKSLLKEELGSTLHDVLEYSQEQDCRLRMLGQMAEFQCRFILENDRALIPPLVNYIQEHVGRMAICPATDLNRIGIALDEALLNALHHGNLELDSELREDGDAYYELAAERCKIEPYRSRRIYVDLLINRDVAEIFIRDEGPGFDPDSLPDPRDPANLGKVSGRGVLLMRTFMDEIKYSDTGNAVLMRKYRAKPENEQVATEQPTSE